MAGARKTDKPRPGEIATSGERDITEMFVGAHLRQPHDRILQTRGGGDWLLYEDLFRDDQVKATFQQRVGAVVSREWVVDAGGASAADKTAADFLREQLDAIRFDDVTGKMLFGLYYGFAVGECVWARDGRRWMAEAIKVRNRRRFRWDRDGNLRLLTREAPQGELLPARKFWTFSAGADHDDDPYGLGLAHWLFWPVFFKRQDIRFWLIFLEKFGQPTVVGKLPSGASAEEGDRLLAAAKAVATEAAVTLKEGTALELLEGGRRGAADYAAMHGVMNAAIAKIVLSQTMTTDDGSSRAQAQVHESVRDHVVKSDADLICHSFNASVARWLTEWNFPTARPPRVWRRVEDAPDLKALAERDAILAGIGYRPSAQTIAETYGEGYEDIGAPKPEVGAAASDTGAPGAPGGQAGASANASYAERDGGAESADDAIDDLVAEMLEAEGWEPLMQPLIAPIRSAIAGADDLPALRSALGRPVMEMDDRRPIEALAQAGFAARLAGKTGADPTGADSGAATADGADDG